MSDAEHSSTRAARSIVQGLLDAGVEHVVLCPGSRSAPLAYAVAGAEEAGALRVHVRVDERSAAFTALGIAMGRGPAAVVTTSGTAVANLLPAVWEAHHAQVPLLLLTADRPRRLRGTWANQTTPLQGSVFAEAALEAVDVETTERPDLRAEVVRLVDVSTGGTDGARWHSGPVHLNAGFDDPLVPQDVDWEPEPRPPGEPDADEDVEMLVAEATAELVSAADGPAPDDEDDDEDVVQPSHLTPRWPSVWLRRRLLTLVVAGDGGGYDARVLAERASWPLGAEPFANASATGLAVPAYRFLLDLPGLGADLGRVVVVGRPTLTRPVARLVARDDLDVVVVDPTPAPGPGSPHLRVADATAFDEPAGGVAHLQRWLDAGRAARRAVDGVLDRRHVLTGLHVARAVARAHAAAPPDGVSLFVGASSIVRDLDVVVDHSVEQPLVHASRGLAGIDGSLSTAGGIALGRGAPVRALVGDLTFLHDTNGLLVSPTEERPPVQVVVANDDGGSIFGLLEHGEDRFAGVHERFFATPHGVDVASLCRAHRVRHRLVTTEAELVDALAAWNGGATEVVEAPTDRLGARALQREVAEAARAAALATLR